jgi:hypothetical protein
MEPHKAPDFSSDGDLRAVSCRMKERRITIPELALIAVTRVALGVGIGLLCSGRLNRDQRRAAGFALLGIGAVSTIPLVVEVLGKAPIEPVKLAA